MKSGAAMRATTLTTALVGTLMTLACSDAGRPAQSGPPPLAEIVASPPSVEEQCPLAGPRPATDATPQTSQVVEAEPVCRLVAVHVATLSPSPSAAYPDPGRGRILHHPRGILTNVAWHMGPARGSLLLWNRDGTFREVIGGPGEGPGEFAEDFRLQAYSGPDGQTYVNERRRWTVLDSTLAFVRIINSPLTGSSGDELVVTGDGGYVRVGGATGSDDAYWFHYFDRDGRRVRSFGPPTPSDASRKFGWRQVVPGTTPASFWASPPTGTPDSYAIEEWNVSGELVAKLERDVPWDDVVLPPSLGSGGIPTFQLHNDGQDLLWLTSVSLREGVEPEEAELAMADMSTEESVLRFMELLEYRVEVIDPARREVVAAASFDTPIPDSGGFPTDPVSGARMGARYVVDENGFRSIELFDWYLVRP